MNRFQRIDKGLLLLFIFTILISSCKQDDEVNPIEENPHAKVNEWIYANMKDVYLWTDHITSEGDKTQEPEDYFSDLLYTGDRFSAIVPNYEELINSLNGVTYEAGYEFSLLRASDENEDVVAVVTYIKKGSPAAQTELQRGDAITHINGTKMTLSNYKDLIGAIDKSHTVQLIRYDQNLGGFTEQPEIELNTVVLAENPSFIHKVITSQTGKKVGYFVYNFFSAGPEATSTAYDDEVRQVFAEFQSAGVEELVLDLRYNGGGSLNSAVQLASLIAIDVNETDIFSQNVWNDRYQDYIETLEDGDEILRRRFLNLPENIGNQLSSGKVYILTGPSTASASELVINGLAPYMDVHLIGGKTVGKNVGSIPIEDEQNPENNYGMLPIVLKISNSLGQSNYEDGFLPGPADQVADFDYPVFPLGDENENLLAHALQLIDGTTGRVSPLTQEKVFGEVIYSSQESKLWSNRIILDEKLPN